MRKVNRKIGAALGLLAGVSLAVFYTGVGMQAQTAPRYLFDPSWPKPLPNKWKISYRSVPSMGATPRGWPAAGWPPSVARDPVRSSAVSLGP